MLQVQIPNSYREDVRALAQDFCRMPQGHAEFDVLLPKNALGDADLGVAMSPAEYQDRSVAAVRLSLGQVIALLPKLWEKGYTMRLAPRRDGSAVSQLSQSATSPRLPSWATMLFQYEDAVGAIGVCVLPVDNRCAVIFAELPAGIRENSDCGRLSLINGLELFITSAWNVIPALANIDPTKALVFETRALADVFEYNDPYAKAQLSYIEISEGGGNSSSKILKAKWSSSFNDIGVYQSVWPRFISMANAQGFPLQFRR